MERGMVLSLSELLEIIGETLEACFAAPLWVVAEIADLRFDQTGHCYLELVEKQNQELRARVRGTIWASFSSVLSSFSAVTGRTLAKGMEILALVRVRFHPVYGLSLDIRDIDPQYSLGAMMRHKKEVLSRLAQEGYLERNRSLPFPPVPQRLAVLSSPHAAGFGDFLAHLQENPYGFRFQVELFPAFVQGEEAELTLLSALEAVRRRAKDFDVLVILRGGGAQSDLHWFDSYTLGKAVATFPLPVLVGIGHQRDETVLDAVAYHSLKTPTAVADFLIERMRAFDELVFGTYLTLKGTVEHLLHDQKITLTMLSAHLERRSRNALKDVQEMTTKLRWRTEECVRRIIEKNSDALWGIWQKLGGALKATFSAHTASLEHITQAVALLDPYNTLRRGYTLTLKQGKIVKSAKECTPGDVLETRFWNGWVQSEVKTREFF